MVQILIHPVAVHILITAPQILVCDLRFCAADIHTAKIYKSLFFQYLIHRICLVIRFPSMAVRAGWIKQDRYIPHKCSHTFVPFCEVGRYRFRITSVTASVISVTCKFPSCIFQCFHNRRCRLFFRCGIKQTVCRRIAVTG